MRRPMLIVALGLGLATMAGAILATMSLSKTSLPVPTKTVVVRLGNLTPEVTLTGWYQAPMPVNLDAGVSGSLQLNVTGVGEEVYAGELLGRIDDPELVATLNQANAQLNEATAAALAAKAEVAVQVANDQQSVAQAQRSATAAQGALVSAQNQESNAASALSAAQSQGAGEPLANASTTLTALRQQLASDQGNIASDQLGVQSADQILASAEKTMNSDPTVTALQAKVSEANAAVNAANALVQQAIDALASANIISPIDGLVAQVLAASGSSVQIGSPVVVLTSASTTATDLQLFVPQSMGSDVAVGDHVHSPGLQAGVIKYVSGTLTSYQGGEGFLATATVPTGTKADPGQNTNVGTPGVPLQVNVTGATLRHVAVVPLTAISDTSGKPTLALRTGRNTKDLPIKVIGRSKGYVAVAGVSPGSAIEVQPS
ncbi:hypothetical protein [Ferrimicrobium acidiphilum]|uniref:hypothetical protein n=1 Tax=Ferrimicrobium acidiphilum TaxID=121039 RepID=UPI0023F1CF84|nr:hypothetical protein [Ferrimicrobium acidiphilum]